MKFKFPHNKVGTFSNCSYKSIYPKRKSKCDFNFLSGMNFHKTGIKLIPPDRQTLFPSISQFEKTVKLFEAVKPSGSLLHLSKIYNFFFPLKWVLFLYPSLTCFFAFLFSCFHTHSISHAHKHF